MSIYDKSSLVLIPSGTKTGKVFSQKPVSGDGDFTFTRASAATRVNADGNIEKETGNLLLQSNSFDTTWDTANSPTLTSGQSGYDGSSNAWLLSKPAASFVNINQDISISGVVTYSVYLKAGTNSTAIIRALRTGGADNQFFVDLSNGTSTFASTSIIDYVIEDVGGGWYRTSISVNDSGLVRFFIYPEAPFGNTTAGNIYIQDAQLEQGLVARDVITTTTAAVYGGITDNTPRLDYTDSSCPALLLEPQRSNLLPHSEYTGSWLTPNSTLTQNDVLSPEGVQNATKFEFSASGSGSTYALRPNASQLTFTNDYLFSVFIKKGNTRYVTLAADFFTTSTNLGFDLDNGTAESGGVIESYGNDWFRLSITNNVTGDADRTGAFYIYLPDSLGAENSVSGNYAYVYGADIQEASYPTSYIPTYGSSVSRVVETCTDAGTSTAFNSTGGVLYVEIAAFADDGTGRVICLSDGTNSHRVLLAYDGNTNQIQAFHSNGVDIINLLFVVSDITNFHKIAFKYSLNDFALWVDGVEVLTDFSGTTNISNTFNNLKFENASGSSDFYGKTKEVIYFPTALSDLDLAILTGATTYNTFAAMALALNYTVYE